MSEEISLKNMIAGKYMAAHYTVEIMHRLKAYFKLSKFRLSFTVAFSAGIGYLLGTKGNVNLHLFFLLLLAGWLVTVASNIINQIIEKDTDALMSRTKKRPLPLGTITVTEAAVLAAFSMTGGLALMLYYFNFNTALISFISLILYAFVYTPLKTRNAIAVFAGAIPGAFPPMIGWLAATNHYGLEPGILFAIQFVWQFPHFWAIAWVLDEDYQKAGIKLLPSGSGKDADTAFKIMIYTLFLIPLGFIPYLLGMTGINSAFIALVCGVLFLSQTFYLMKECTNRAAKLIMFGSFLYLPLVQIAFVLDKV